MTLIADVFPQLPSPKNVVRSMSKKLCFRGPFNRPFNRHVGISTTVPLKSLLITVTVFALKKSLLVIYKILRLFVKILTADDKHYLLHRDKLTQPIQMQLSQKQKTFSQFFFSFLKSILNFNHFPREDDPHR